MSVPEDIKATLYAALAAKEDAFFEAQEDFDDYSDEDIAEHEAMIAKAQKWLDEN